MTSPANAGRAALDRLDRANRRVTKIIISVALVEGAMMVLVFLTMDFSDQLHRLVFLSSMLTYFTLGLGLVALGAHVSRVGERLLSALELLRTPEAR